MLFDEDVAARSRRKKKRLSSVFLKHAAFGCCCMHHAAVPFAPSRQQHVETHAAPHTHNAPVPE
jgi:hypothetical protein